MMISKTHDKMIIRSIEQVKLFMSILFLSLGFLALISPLLIDNSGWLPLIGVVIIAAISTMLIEVTYIFVQLSKNGVSKIAIKSLRHKEEFEFNISDIESVIKKEYVGIGNGSNEPNDLLILNFKDREDVEIAATRQKTLSAKIFRPYRRNAKEIADFIGVPLEIKQTNPLNEIKDLVDTNIFKNK